MEITDVQGFLECPNCGNWSIILKPMQNMIDKTQLWKCGCEKCGTYCIRDTKEKAIAAWNNLERKQ